MVLLWHYGLRCCLIYSIHLLPGTKHISVLSVKYKCQDECIGVPGDVDVFGPVTTEL